MSLDTKYRPQRYEDVLGQEATARILCEIVRQGKGRHQSYVFGGGHGSGKTTMGRILARALLCENPVGGAPCDKCDSCVSILERGSSEEFIELDAATKSGKEHIATIVADAEFSTLAGNGRVYLFDEAHQMSKQALDGLLKSMEDSIPGSGNKKLVCIFCTTEPEKMRDTIFSRCAPAFSIRSCPPELIAERMAYVCEQEGIEYERSALVTIAEINRSHIRPCMKAIESLGNVGKIDEAAVSTFLRLDNIARYLKILAFIGKDLPAALKLLDELNDTVSPSTVYSNLAEASLMAYKTHLGVLVPVGYWKPDFMKKLGKFQGERLLTMANLFSSRPSNTSMPMVSLDISRLHHAFTGALPITDSTTVVVQAPSPASVQVSPKGTPTPSSETQGGASGTIGVQESKMVGLHPGTPSEAMEIDGVYIDPRAVRRISAPEASATAANGLSVESVQSLLSSHLRELKDGRGLKGRPQLGGAGVDENG